MTDIEESSDKRSQPVTMQDIAKASGVSQSTVSRVLSGSSTSIPIAGATRRRVFEAAERLGYRPNPLARGLRGAKTMLLGVIVRDIADLFFTNAVEAVSLSARERSYNVVLGSAHSRADEAIALRSVLETRHCDGIVLLGDMWDQRPLMADLAASHVPVVALWQGSRLAGMATINADNRGGIIAGVDHLVELGHRRFGFIGGFPHDDVKQRQAAMVERLGEVGITPAEIPIETGENTLSSGAESFRRMAACEPRPTAIVAATDQVAIGALHAAHALGVDIPGQVSIIGFDDIPLTEFTAPPLTTIRQPLADMADAAVAIATGAAEVPDDDQVFPTTLVIRETTGPPPDRA